MDKMDGVDGHGCDGMGRMRPMAEQMVPAAGPLTLFWRQNMGQFSTGGEKSLVPEYLDFWLMADWKKFAKNL
jgi:hypothetical protein